MHKRQSKRQALTDCVKLWTWLKANPDETKAHYYMDHDIPPENIPYSECPCCQYMRDHEARGNYCNQDCLISWGDSGCMDDSSPYAEWADLDFQGLHHESYLAERERLAGIILNRAKSSLSSLPPPKTRTR